MPNKNKNKNSNSKSRRRISMNKSRSLTRSLSGTNSSRNTTKTRKKISKPNELQTMTSKEFREARKKGWTGNALVNNHTFISLRSNPGVYNTIKNPYSRTGKSYSHRTPKQRKEFLSKMGEKRPNPYIEIRSKTKRRN